MAHNLEIRNNQASMAYVGEKPWHGLGTEVQKAMTAEEALKLARLDFSVVKHPVFNPLTSEEIDNFYATIRLDTKQVLGIVKGDYRVVQNRDLFTVLDPLVERSEAIYHTAGVMGIGQRVWLLAKLPDSIVLKNKAGKEDVIEEYVLLTNSHDGNSTGKALMTPVRVVCNNTLTWAINGATNVVSVRHTSGAKEKLAEASKVLGLAKKYYAEAGELLNQFTLVKFSDTQLSSFLDELLNVKATLNQYNEIEAKVSASQQKAKAQLTELYHAGAGAELFEGTAYNYLQAVTEFVSHHKDTRGDRVSSLMFGAGATMRQKAFAQIGSLI